MIDVRHPKKMLRLAQLELRSLPAVEGMRSSATARAAVLAGLWAHYNACTDAPVWPSQRLLADLAGGASVSTVQRALHDLEVLGLFERDALTAAERGRRQTTRYRLRLSSHWGGSKAGAGSSGSKGGTGSSGSKAGAGSSGSKADLMRRATVAAEADRLEGAAAAAAAAAKQAQHIALLRAGDPAAIARREAEYAWAESLRLEGLAAQRARVASAARPAWVVERDKALERLRAILEETEADDEAGATGTGASISGRGEVVPDGRAGDARVGRDGRCAGPAGHVVVVGTGNGGLAAEAPDATVVDAAHLGLPTGSVSGGVLELIASVLEPAPDGRPSAAAPTVAARPTIEADDWMRARRAELKRQLASVLAGEAQRAATLARWSGAAVLALVFVFGLFSSVLGSAKGPALGVGTVQDYLTGSEAFRELEGGRVDQAEVIYVNRGSDSSGGRCGGGLVVVLGTAGGGGRGNCATPLRHGAGARSGRGEARAALFSGVSATSLGSVGSELGVGAILAARVGGLRGAVALRGRGVLAGVSPGAGGGSSERTSAGLIAGMIGGISRDCAGDQASKQVSRWGPEGSIEPDLRRAWARVGQVRSRIRSSKQAPERASG